MTGARHPSSLPARRRAPLAGRLPLDPGHREAILHVHEAALDAGVPGYLDPVSGLFVFTAGELWAKGTCCRSSCRHCPYEPGERVSPERGTEER